MRIDKPYIVAQHKIICQLEEKAHKKKLEFERLLEKNMRGNNTIEVIQKNHKRMLKLNDEMFALMAEKNKIQSELREQIHCQRGTKI